MPISTVICSGWQRDSLARMPYHQNNADSGFFPQELAITGDAGFGACDDATEREIRMVVSTMNNAEREGFLATVHAALGRRRQLAELH